MSRKILVLIYIYMVFRLNASCETSGGIEIGYESIRSASMGHAGVGIYHGGAGISINPGGLAFLRKSEIDISGFGQTSYTAFQGQFPSVYSTTTPRQVITPLTFHAAFPLFSRFDKQTHFQLGIAYYSPFATKSIWDKDWTGRFMIQELTVLTGTLQPTLSYNIRDKIGLGIGPTLTYIDIEYRRAIPLMNAKEGTMTMSGLALGSGVNIGVFYRITEHLSMGMSYRSPIKMNLKQGKIIYSTPEIDREKLPTSFQNTFFLPQIIKMGLGIHPNEHWVVALEANYIGWKNLGTSNIHYDTILPRKLELIESLSLLNSWVARVGIEGNIRRKLYGRVGGFYRTSPLSEENVAPQFFDANTIGITAGAGYRWNQRWALAISGSYSFTGERSFLFAPANFGGVIQQNTFSMGAGISLQLH